MGAAYLPFLVLLLTAFAGLGQVKVGIPRPEQEAVAREWESLGPEARIRIEGFLWGTMGGSATGTIHLVGGYTLTQDEDLGRRGDPVLQFQEETLFGSGLLWSVLVNPKQNKALVLYNLGTTGKAGTLMPIPEGKTEVNRSKRPTFIDSFYPYGWGGWLCLGLGLISFLYGVFLLARPSSLPHLAVMLFFAWLPLVLSLIVALANARDLFFSLDVLDDYSVPKSIALWLTPVLVCLVGAAGLSGLGLLVFLRQCAKARNS
jgi:hypothetical protein